MGAGYSGGHVLAIDGAGEGARVHDYGVPVEGEGLISFALDARRGHCYAVSWPSGAFVHATLPGFEAHSAGGELATSEEFQAAGMDAAATDALRNAVRGRESFSLESGLRGGIIHGLFGGGELAEGTSDAYQVLPRTLLVDPETGLLYMTLQGGEIVAYSPAMRDVVVLSTSMRLKYFGDVRVGAGSMGFHLRQGMWHARERAFLATHGNSGYLYWFDPPRPGGLRPLSGCWSASARRPRARPARRICSPMATSGSVSAATATALFTSQVAPSTACQPPRSAPVAARRWVMRIATWCRTTCTRGA